MTANLTTDAIPILSSVEKPVDLKPVLQVTDIRVYQSPTAGGGERYMFTLSDGTWTQQGIISTRLNELVKSQKLQKGSIAQLNEFVCNSICERLIIIILDLNVIVGNCGIIGDPKQFPRQLPAAPKAESFTIRKDPKNRVKVMGSNLSMGALPMLSSEGKPVLQVTYIRALQAQSVAVGERYRCMLSDGSFIQQGILCARLNEMVRSKRLQKGSIVQLTEFICNSFHGNVIIIIMDLNVIQKCDIIGDPMQIPFQLSG